MKCNKSYKSDLDLLWPNSVQEDEEFCVLGCFHFGVSCNAPGGPILICQQRNWEDSPAKNEFINNVLI